MDTRDRFWIVAAGTVALASIALSAFIVIFAPEDPYMPVSKAELRSQPRAPDGESNRRNEGPASNASRNATDSDDAAHARNDNRIAYAAGGAAAGLAMMFAVLGWGDRNDAAHTPAEACPVLPPRHVLMPARRVLSTAGAPCRPDADDGEVSATVAMIALGFGAFVGRHDKESTSLGNLSRRDGVGSLQDRASGAHLSAAGYGVAAIDPPCGENRRRGDRRNPFATPAVNIDERRGTVRRIADVAHHVGGGERPSRVAPGVARLETT